MIELGSTGQFETVREFLRSRYSEEMIRGGVRRSDGSGVRYPGHRQARPGRTRAVVVCGAAVPFSELRRVLPKPVGDAMGALGLLAASGDHVWCPVVLYPLEDLHLISDRFTHPDGSPFTGDREFVYFALTANTMNYLDSLPADPCESFLRYRRRMRRCGSAGCERGGKCDQFRHFREVLTLRGV